MIKDQRFLQILSECRWMYSFDEMFCNGFFLVYNNRFIVLNALIGASLFINDDRRSPIKQWIYVEGESKYKRAVIIRETVLEHFSLGEIHTTILMAFHEDNYIQFGLRY